MSNKDACFNCQDRLVTEDYNCHSHCDRYAAYKEQIKNKNKSDTLFVERVVRPKKPWRESDVRK